MSTILPANASLLERAIDAATASIIERITPPIPELMNPAETPAEFLPYLAADRGVYEWANTAAESAQRDMVASSWAVKRLAGTRHAIKRGLTTAGYPVVRIQSSEEYRGKWRAAGGEFLDGAGDLSTGDLSAPPGSFRFVASYWAEYALTLNTADLSITAEMQRRVAALCEAYGPLRSRLGAIILALSADFTSTPVLTRYKAKGRLRLADCRRFAVPSFDTLDGCDLLGGETLPDCIDGGGTLDGSSTLLPERYIGEPLDGGQLGFTSQGRVALCGTALGGNRIEPPEYLDSTALLDGTYTIAGETLDGSGLLDSGSLYYPTLADAEDTLDGSTSLGEAAGLAQPWFSGVVRIRRGSTVTSEAL